MYTLQTLFFSSILAFIFSSNQGGSWSLNVTILFGVKFYEKKFINVELKRLTYSFIGKMVKDPNLFLPIYL